MAAENFTKNSTGKYSQQTPENGFNCCVEQAVFVAVWNLLASTVCTAFYYDGVYMHVAADWVTPLTHPSNERKRTSKPVAHCFTPYQQNIVQPGNHIKMGHSPLRHGAKLCRVVDL